ECPARGRVDALVTVIPADAVARRGVAPEHLLDHARARWAIGGLRLRFDDLAYLEGHLRSHSVRTLAGRRPRTTQGSTARACEHPGRNRLTGWISRRLVPKPGRAG